MGKNRIRAKTSLRGYGTRHQRIRRAVEPYVRAGLAVCPKCGKRIEPDEPFDLGHDDLDRSKHTGAEHVRCNRATSWGRVQSQEW